MCKSPNRLFIINFHHFNRKLTVEGSIPTSKCQGFDKERKLFFIYSEQDYNGFVVSDARILSQVYLLKCYCPTLVLWICNYIYNDNLISVAYDCIHSRNRPFYSNTTDYLATLGRLVTPHHHTQNQNIANFLIFILLDKLGFSVERRLHWFLSYFYFP